MNTQMNTQTSLERCQAFINCQVQPASPPAFASRSGSNWRAVTISRQAGAGGHTVARRLAEYLQIHGAGGQRPWLVFDENLAAEVLKDHHLPARLAAFMPEDRVPEIRDILEEVLGAHPPVRALVRKTAETILHLAELGNAILIGRGANIITASLESVFHVRLIGSLTRRVAHIREIQRVGEKAALKFVRVEDRGRRRYLRKYHDQDIDNPLLYHLVINTDLVGYDKAAALIGDAVLGVSARAIPIPHPN
jgi:cytidylate kinase